VATSQLELGRYLKLGRGEEAGGGRRRISILADATEAVFAAVYLDGGIEAARSLIHRVLLDAVREEAVEERRRDFKTALQELVQRQADQVLTYRMVGEHGPDHAKVFTAEVLLNGSAVGSGSGHSKKEAEQSAARAALKKLEN
jgi:ribonuclease-3